MLFKCDYKLLHRIYFECEENKASLREECREILNKPFVVKQSLEGSTNSSKDVEKESSITVRRCKLHDFTNKHVLKILIRQFNSLIMSNGATWYHIDAPSSTSTQLQIHFTPPPQDYVKLRKADILKFAKDLNVVVKFV